MMANERAIAAVSEAIRKVLRDNVSAQEFAGVPCDIYQTSDMQKAGIEAVSIYLYRVNIDPNLRNRAPSARGGSRSRPSLLLDLHYLLTAWGQEPVRQQVLLARAIRVMDKNPLLPSALLNQYGAAFGPTEVVQVVAESLSSEDEASIWEVAEAQRQPSLGYMARVSVGSL